MLYALVGLPFVTLAQFITSFILTKLNINYNIIDKLELFDSTSMITKLLFFVQIAVLPAIFEELLMRKGLVGYSKNKGKGFAMLISSFLFATMHMNLSQFFFAFMLGMVFSYIYLKTNRLFPTIVLHLVNNGLAAITLIFQDQVMIVGIVGFCYLLNLAGFILFIIFASRKWKNRRKKQEKKEEMIPVLKAIMTDYTFIIMIVTMLILSIYTEKMLTIL